MLLVVSKRKKELVGPEAKRSRSQSPGPATDFKLPPFSPSNPLGKIQKNIFNHQYLYVS